MISNKTYRWHVLMIAFEIMMLALLLAEGAGAATITVNASGSADYTRIQDAINNASNGDTILVASGTYYENVNINKSVSLVGVGPGILILNALHSNDPVLDVISNSVNISGFTIANGRNSGLYIRANYVNISNNIIINNSNGIYLFSSNNNTVAGNIIRNNVQSGIHIYFSDHNVITDNNVLDNDGAGISVLYYNNIITGNRFYNNTGDGIYIVGDRANNNVVSGNNASNNRFGLNLAFNGHNFITENEFSYNSYGISMHSDNNTLNSNIVRNNTNGIDIQNSKNNSLYNNTMFGNLYNFGLQGDTDSSFNNDIDISNTVEGKSIFYIENSVDTIYESSVNAGTFYCIWCDNITIRDLTLTKNRNGIFFWKTQNSRIENITTMNNSFGIYLINSINNNLTGNNVSNNTEGIHLIYSSNNSLSDNIAMNNYNGIEIYPSSNNITIKRNIVINNNFIGIRIVSSNHNTIASNRVSSDYLNPVKYGIRLSDSDNNTIYDNYFDNQYNFYYETPSNDTWNITKNSGINIVGGPYLGGNFWINHYGGGGFSWTCADVDVDGICDSNYTLNSLNIDYLPLASPDNSPPSMAISSPLNGTIVNTSTMTVSGTSSDLRSGIQKVEVQIDGGVFNTASGTNSWSYVASSLTDGLHNITGRATDNASNTVLKSINITVDTIPPAIITNLTNVTYASTYINWTWTDPQEPDFAKVKVYLDGVYKNDVLKGVQYYNATGLAQGTYTIGTRTMDVVGNINATMKTHTSTTILPAVRFINGTVFDSVNRTAIPDVTVITNTSNSTVSNTTGFYSLVVTSGTYNLTATFEPKYYTNSSMTVSTVSSAVVVQDIEILKKQTGNISGSVTTV